MSTGAPNPAGLVQPEHVQPGMEPLPAALAAKQHLGAPMASPRCVHTLTGRRTPSTTRSASLLTTHFVHSYHSTAPTAQQCFGLPSCHRHARQSLVSHLCASLGSCSGWLRHHLPVQSWDQAVPGNISLHPFWQLWHGQRCSAHQITCGYFRWQQTFKCPSNLFK